MISNYQLLQKIDNLILSTVHPKFMPSNSKIIKFIRQRDLQFVKELGRGACGKTVLLYDDVIEEDFVCKKYSPIEDELKEELFENFIREIKLLHLANHTNIVRVFNYYLYPDLFSGFILMEHIDGTDIEDHIKKHPEQLDGLFLQCIAGLRYLESIGVLHRDIRPKNILVTENGAVKIIDLGFGKKVQKTSDFDKSVTLNWWCDPPKDFETQTYNFCTEVYFVGKMFEKIIMDYALENFAYKQLLTQMCQYDSNHRISSFAEIEKSISAEKLSEGSFPNSDLATYRKFASDISAAITGIETQTKYYEDVSIVERKLEEVYRKVMLEEFVPKSNIVLSCFLNGSYRYSTKYFIKVENLRKFVELIRSCSAERKVLVLDNLLSRLDAAKRFNTKPFDFADDIPF